MKNLFGILGDPRGDLHENIGTTISDLGRGFKVDLNIVDAFRVLFRNGPVGGNLNDVALRKTVIISDNIMFAEVVAADFFGKKPSEVGFIREANKKNMGLMDVNKIKVKKC